VFHDAYNRAGSVKDFVPVLMEVPGCPPRPEKIVEALAIAASKLREV
jgi:Ni,Fe-hydrogenase III small subunit